MEKLRIMLQLFADPDPDPEKVPFLTIMDGDEPIFTSETPDDEGTITVVEDDESPDSEEDPGEEVADVEPDPIFFPRLRVVDKNLQHSQIGTLLVADEEGNILTVEADEDGAVREQNMLIEDNNILDGSISGGKLQESTITSREIDMNEIFSDSELIKQLLAMNIDAAALFDNEGFMEKYDERYWQTYVGRELDATDLNEVVEPGRYYAATGENVESKPMDATGFALDVLKTGEGTLKQEFRAGKELYVRDGTEAGKEEESEETEESGNYKWKVWTRRYLSPVDLTGEEVDLNDFTYANGYTDGQWKSTTDAGTAKIGNLPEKRAFELKLSCPSSESKTDYVMRMELMHGYSKAIWERWCVRGVWSAWKECVKDGVSTIVHGGTGAGNRKDGINNLINLGTNPIASPANDTTQAWAALGNGIASFNITGCLIEQPQQYGTLLSIHSGGNEINQIWMSRSSGALYFRSGNSNGWNGNGSTTGVFKRVLDSVSSHASTATTYGVASEINYGHAMASSLAPVVAGTATAGTDNGKFAREGHVHAAQTTITGNAGSATKLVTPRNINGKSFDGTADITFGSLYPTEIPASSNLNNYTQSGMYFCPANATVATLTNVPTVYAFYLLVGRHAGTYQMLVEYITSNPKIYFRNYYNGAWSSWYRLYSTGDAPTTITGNAATATKLANAQTFAISGGATGTATSFNGSTGITIPVTALNASNITSGTIPSSDRLPTVPVAKGGTGASDMVTARKNLGMKTGSVTFTMSGAYSGNGPTITFKTAFSATPKVFLQFHNYANTSPSNTNLAHPVSISTSGFTISYAHQSATASSVTIVWFAIEKEE